VIDQSFSVIVEGEKQGIVSVFRWSIDILCVLLQIVVGNKYAALQSLDLICDSPEEKQLWCDAVSSNSLIHA